VRAATGGEGVDAAVEYTGASELMRLCIDALRLGGTFCPVGGELREIPLRVVDMVSKELNVHGIRGATRNDQRVVAVLLEKGRIGMLIYAVLPRAKAVEAHDMLESGEDLLSRHATAAGDEAWTTGASCACLGCRGLGGLALGRPAPGGDGVESPAQAA